MWKMENVWLCLSYRKARPILILILLCAAEGPKPSQPVPGSTRNYSTTESTTKRDYRFTTPMQMSFVEECDYLAYYCLKAYKTGNLCGRTVYYRYQDFDNYCMLDYINCMERYEVWKVSHMGECFNITVLTDYIHYEYLDDHFLDSYYVIQD